MMYPTGSTDAQSVWLDKLGKRLVWALPGQQVLEILSDYRGQLQEGLERGRNGEEMLRSLGSPQEAADRIWEESPPAGGSLLRHYAFWGSLTALCLFALFVFWRTDSVIFVWLSGAALFPLGIAAFLLLRGRERVEIEKGFPPPALPSPALTYCLPMGTAVAVEALLQLITLAALNGWWPQGPFFDAYLFPGFAVQLACLIPAGAMALLAVGLVVLSVRRSIRYFPGVLHALGAADFCLASLLPYIAMDLEKYADPSAAQLLYIPLYLAGLVIARIFQGWTDGRRPLPGWFRERPATRQEWLAALGRCLAGPFPAAQALEILSDYREQFELGAERGRAEADLAASFGAPETVTRDLLSENPALKRRARRHLLWVLPLLVALRLMWNQVGLYFFGSFGGVHFAVSGVSQLALLLGSVSLFVLLRGKNRAVIEARFPPERGPSPWVLLVPAALAAAAAGLSVFLLMHPDPIPVRLVMLYLFELSTPIAALLAVWAAGRTVSASIRYFPYAVHTAGVLAFMAEAGLFFQHLDPAAGSARQAVQLFRKYGLSVYLFTLLLTAVFWVLIRRWGGTGKGAERWTRS